MDRLTKAERSANMARIRGGNTTPELRLRSALHGLGLRYRLHARELPGSPDIVFRPQKYAVFVHGCFWHRHADCQLTTTPKTNTKFWKEKFRANVARDKKVYDELLAMGWTVYIVWECQTGKSDQLMRAAHRIAQDIELKKRQAERH